LVGYLVFAGCASIIQQQTTRIENREVCELFIYRPALSDISLSKADKFNFLFLIALIFQFQIISYYSNGNSGIIIQKKPLSTIFKKIIFYLIDCGLNFVYTTIIVGIQEIQK
jgi:hypothetical protein